MGHGEYLVQTPPLDTMYQGVPPKHDGNLQGCVFVTGESFEEILLMVQKSREKNHRLD